MILEENLAKFLVVKNLAFRLLAGRIAADKKLNLAIELDQVNNNLFY
ncbi:MULTISPECIES: hypothetical protein [unclassified Microcoleus]|nr:MULTISPECIES: hypothetical protein [unclassified Microcoleus]MCC3441679.1 hypothetical protein [Microcoleus sp. PH2017_03_ELD_O_A]MCC3467013.1 hypothetical protein [Microcoleus sp. PH2017_06_SFM_O_A]MCC3505631.1 hypothetical protein [Microcoleus sp. PH2017_19_SFW_U_A]MCC3415352.1 hypothetical protein [Microcoleus sp. PH2017_02_FOX_O_A]MCC3439433.1 hypothetical protein [Microcoleus sp. PH2017_05_CCC_O_A]